MRSKVETFIIQRDLLKYDSTPVIAGVSGGADSVALLDILHTLGYNCIIAHCNFHLRGKESDSDEAFVEKLAGHLNLPYHKIDFDTVGYAELKGISIEMAARDLRYEWFDKLLHEHKAQAIAVAHHADDSAETMLMNLIRGTGLKGITGIPARNGQIVRPLLSCYRSEIETYLTQRHLQYVTDSTNISLDYTRNKIRNQIIPLLEEINPSVRYTLNDNRQRFEEAYQLYKQEIDKIKDKVISTKDDITCIDTRDLTAHPAASSILFEILSPCGFNNSQVKQIAANMNDEPGKQFFSATHRLIIDRNELIVCKQENITDENYRILETDVELKVPFEIYLRKIEITPDFSPSKDALKVHLDLSKLTFPLELRRWQAGDSFQPYGMKGVKKLSDYFTDLKLNLLEKENIWILTSADKIVWVVGHRIDDNFKIDKNTRQVLEIKI